MDGYVPKENRLKVRIVRLHRSRVVVAQDVPYHRNCSQARDMFELSSGLSYPTWLTSTLGRQRASKTRVPSPIHSSRYITMAITLNMKQTKARASKMEERALAMRTELWPGVPEEYFWDRKKEGGFTTMPRTMTYLMNIIDTLTKGQPAGLTYLTIWCRLYLPGIVALASEKQMAFEAGFTGERAVDTWRKRMRHLKKHGFIDYKPGNDHEFQWVLVLNPHHAVLRLGNKVQERYRAAWRDRATEVGAKDLGALPEAVKKELAKHVPHKASAKKAVLKRRNSQAVV